MNRPRVVLADDHQMVAEGLRGILEPDFELLEIVTDGRQLVNAVERLQPDVVIADISMPRLNGLDAIRQLQRVGCCSKIVCLTMHSDAMYAVRAIRAGASAYVLKQSASTELLHAINGALLGRSFITPSLAEAVTRSLSEWPEDSDEETLLTPRQREVLQLFAEGHSAKEVARTLQISTRTAENHKAQIMRLTNASSSAELVRHAIRLGLIPAP